MTKYAIDLGHGCGQDRGAEGIELEETLINQTGKRLIEKLIRLGHEVVEVRPRYAETVNDSLKSRVETANDAGSDLYIALHANKWDGNVHGTECYSMSPYADAIASRICDSIAALGFNNRGVKSGSHLYVIKNSDMPAVLIEQCFCDSKRDISLFNAKKMANAICVALTGKLPQD